MTRSETSSRSVSSLDTIRVLLIALSVAVFVGYLIIYLDYAVALFRFPFDYDPVSYTHLTLPTTPYV